jgi:hypothetical protein
MLWFYKFGFAISVQRFHVVFGREPTEMSVYKWYKSFQQTALVKEKAQEMVTEAQMDEESVAFVRSPCKSTRHFAQQLNVPHTVHNNLEKLKKFKSYRYHLLGNMYLPNTKKFTYIMLSCFQDFMMREMEEERP